MLTDVSSNAPTFASSDPVISLTRVLRDLPLVHEYRYTDEARLRLLEELFASLAGNNREYIKLFFPNGVPPKTGKDAWNLSKAQGAVEGAEYGPAARGKPCGHIFKNGEATYRCKTCSLDETSVLCAKCFESSDHRDHSVFVSISPGNSGCCDCGDREAWRRDVKCAIHTAYEHQQSAKTASQQTQPLPESLRKSIRDTIARALDYLCDIIACSPEQLREAKSEDKVREDEAKSRLQATYYEVAETEMAAPEFSLILWNDEKHTVREVQDQLGRACRKPKDWCLKRAEETDLIGRSVVDFSTDIQNLLDKSKIIERIKLTMTLRSSRDTFREQMCGTIIEWLVDIAGCAVGDDPDVLRRTVCEELLGVWRQGSKAWNIEIGMKGIDDHEYAESQQTLEYAQSVMQSPEIRLLRAQQEQEERAQREANGEEEEEEEEAEETEETQEEDRGSDSMEVDGGEGSAAAAATPAASADADGDVNMSTGETPSAADPTAQAEPTVPFPPPFAPSIPHTPGKHHKRREAHGKPGVHWLETTHIPHKTTPYYEDLRQRVRLDWLIMFDLRMWKKARIDLRELYISTVVAIPQFKRILGLRFAGLYTILSQLYLIADREPDHSIINLSLQMLTTPSITAEVVSRGNFLTSLMAILYTFLTTRQVGHPADVNPNATLAFDTGSLTNRRMYHFFQDMKYLFGSESVKELLRTRVAPTLQFLDLVKLHQGICYNNRAIGSHIEYESDAWICASLITREINKLCRQYADAFRRTRAGEDIHLANAIRLVAKITTRHAAGMERQRFKNAEIREEVEFVQQEVREGEEDKLIGLPGFDMEGDANGVVPSYRIVKYKVETEAISFHHAMHYLLSWLIEAGNGMDNAQLRSLLRFKTEELGVPESWKRELDAEDYLSILFDYPLRVCVWLSQMKAGMWVRNGFSLRHQMNTYKGVSQRDLTYNRDIFMLQVASVVIEPSKWLLTMINRFTLDLWFRGDFRPPTNIEATQHLDLVEDLYLLLISLLSDRLLLISHDEERDIPTLQLRREITHVLCSKASSFSDISQRIPDRLMDLENFQDVLAEMATYKAPDGLSDSGIYELKGEWKEYIDPYILQNSKNQREEAEAIFKKHMATKLNIPEKNVVYEPKLKPIRAGAFMGLANITRTKVFNQMIYFGLLYGAMHKSINPSIPDTRIDSYMHALLYLMQVAVAEDTSPIDATEDSYVYYALTLNAKVSDGLPSEMSEVDTVVMKKETVEKAPTVALLLYKIKLEALHESCTPIIDNLLQHMQEKKPAAFAPLLEIGKGMREKESEEAAKVQKEEEEFARKKELAKQRQANIMAQFQAQQQSFMQNNFGGFDMDDDDLDDEFMDEDAPGVAIRPTWEFPTGDCIMCSEQLDDSKAFGTFAMIQETNVLRQTDLKDSDYVYEVLVTPENLDRSAEGLRPFGVAGMNRDSVKKLAEDGSEITVTRQGLGKGYPRAPEFTRSGPVAVGCGHLMHYDCFESHIAAVQRRHQHQISRAHPERLEMKEFLCPLCKALGNTFLPIVWKPKFEETVAEAVHTKSDFSTWLSQDIGPAVLRLEKEKAADNNDEGPLGKYKEQFLGYGTSNFIEGIATKLVPVEEEPPAPEVTTPTPEPATTATDGTAPAPTPVVVIPVGGAITIEQQLAMLPQQGAPVPPPVATIPPPAPASRNSDRPSVDVESIFSIYKRMRDTLQLNKIKTNRPPSTELANPTNDLHSVDALMRILGFTISTTETWLRGAEPRQGSNLIERTPEHNLRYLRVLAESVYSYIVFGGLKEESSTASHYKEIHQDQMVKLFVGHPKIYGDNNIYQKHSPLFADDIFVFLAECSLCLCPALNVDFKHIMTLCYLAEIVKAIVVISKNSEALDLNAARDDGERFSAIVSQLSYSEQDINNFKGFVEFVAQASADPDMQGGHSSPSPILFRHLISKYINPFLRKCVYLLHARYMVTFSNDNSTNFEPEHVRLTKLLGLPSLETVFTAHAAKNDDGAEIIRAMVTGWCKHLRFAVEESKREEAEAATPKPTPTEPIIDAATASTTTESSSDAQPPPPPPPAADPVAPPPPVQPVTEASNKDKLDLETLVRLSHPSILELVGLPLHYDTLVEEAMKRRCPRSGRELSDPVVCLLCGDIFCSQSLCCMDANRHGGANQHLKM
ncbi:hypothetical protein H072_8783 [Dactylellina haptotyla CBS 200.50]|uniref:E3 ubiquitin-protein ligase n=1 Tax=Dactylellina haptotyla (strain CBS 200.50) TaxID=1284197 RepID=S8BQI9_DACHA|nr:hypothetical protein H072_8783 [Dactylellina haptotyla CBS 200.50]